MLGTLEQPIALSARSNLTLPGGSTSTTMTGSGLSSANSSDIGSGATGASGSNAVRGPTRTVAPVRRDIPGWAGAIDSLVEQTDDELLKPEPRDILRVLHDDPSTLPLEAPTRLALGPSEEFIDGHDAGRTSFIEPTLEIGASTDHAVVAEQLHGSALTVDAKTTATASASFWPGFSSATAPGLPGVPSISASHWAVRA